MKKSPSPQELDSSGTGSNEPVTATIEQITEKIDAVKVGLSPAERTKRWREQKRQKKQLETEEVSEAEKILKELVKQSLTGLVGLVDGIIEARVKEWERLSQNETASLVMAVDAVITKYAPAFGEYGAEIGLMLTLAGIVGKRYAAIIGSKSQKERNELE